MKQEIYHLLHYNNMTEQVHYLFDQEPLTFEVPEGYKISNGIETIVLSKDAAAQFVEELLHPSEPNQALKDLFKGE